MEARVVVDVGKEGGVSIVVRIDGLCWRALYGCEEGCDSTLFRGRRTVDEDGIEEVEELDSLARDPVALDVWSRCRCQDSWSKTIVEGAVAGGVGRVADEAVEFTALRDDERV